MNCWWKITKFSSFWSLVLGAPLLQPSCLDILFISWTFVNDLPTKGKSTIKRSNLVTIILGIVRQRRNLFSLATAHCILDSLSISFYSRLHNYLPLSNEIYVAKQFILSCSFILFVFSEPLLSAQSCLFNTLCPSGVSLIRLRLFFLGFWYLLRYSCSLL